MRIEIVRGHTTRSALKELASESFGDFVKAVVDVELRLMAVGGDMHSDEESVLLDAGSTQKNLWGINIYPDITTAEWVEFDSMINVRPSDGNRSREVESPAIRQTIFDILSQLVQR